MRRQRYGEPSHCRRADQGTSHARRNENRLVVYLANFFGALGLVFLVVLSNHGEMNSNAVGSSAVKIAPAKAALPFREAFFRGILCNILVCLAVWLALAARSVVDKIFAVIFPISPFVAAGFEHSVANMYFIPLGIPGWRCRKSVLVRPLLKPLARNSRQHHRRRSHGSAG